MSDFRDDIYPGAGQLNWDDDIWTMPRHHSRYINNVVINDDGNQSMAVNSPGNTLVTLYNYEGTGKVIQALEDLEDKTIIIFIYESGGLHRIEEYDISSGSVTTILDGDALSYVGDVLNFQEDAYLSVDIFGSGDDKTIVFTDGVNPPRQVNKKWAIDFTNDVDFVQSNYDEGLFEQAISLIKPAPSQLSLEYYSDTELMTNNLKTEVFQFSHRSKFSDKSYSIFSELSVIYPDSEEINEVRLAQNTTKNNTILVEGEILPEHSYIDIAYRKLSVDGSVGNFFKADTFGCFYVSDTSKSVTQTAISFVRFYQLDVDSGDIDDFHVYQKLVNVTNGGSGYVSSVDTDSNIVYVKASSSWGSDGAVDVEIQNEFRYPFRNENVSIPLSNTLVLKQYESIPYTSKNIKAINSSNISGTRLSLTGNEIGQDVPDVSVQLERVTEDLSYGRVIYDVQLANDNPSGEDFTVDFSQVTERVYTIVFHQLDIVIIVYSNQFETPSDYAQYIIDRINDEASSHINATIPSPGATTINLENISSTLSSITVRIKQEDVKPSYYDSANQYPYWHFKHNQIVSLGLLYQDKYGRSSYIAKDEGCDIFIPPYTDMDGDSEYNHSGYINAIKYTLGHNPPDWADRWSWCMSVSNLYKFYAMAVRGFGAGSYIEVNDGFMDIDLFDSVSVAGGSVDNLQPEDYFEPVEGDRVQFIGFYTVDSGSASFFNREKVQLFDSYIDVEVVSYSSGILRVPDISKDILESTGFSSDTQGFISIQIYRPKKDVSDDTTSFFQVGSVHPVGESSGVKVHELSDSASWLSSVTTQNQTSVQDCIGVLDFGNAWVQYRNSFNWVLDIGDEIPYNPGWVESRSYFMTKNYPAIGEGKVYLKNDDIGREYKNEIVWGNIYSDESAINNIYRFDFEDFVPVNEQYGDVYVTDQIGNVLLVIQENKVNSVYLGAEQAVDAAGNRGLSYSNNIINSVNPSPQKYGTRHPKSYDRNSRNAYWFDLNNADVIRYATNGMHPLGELYKMKTYFREKAREIIDGGIDNYDVIGKYDEYENMYKITFVDKNTPANSETLAFYEPQNRWVSFYDYTPELYGKFGSNEFVSFRDGQLYIHGSSTRNTFYGAAFDSEVWILSNLPQGIKLFDSIEVNSNDLWTAPDNDSVVISPTELYSNGMQSRLRDSQFENREGVYEAPFLRDMLTTSNSPKVFDLLEGRELRGREITVKLKNSSTSEVRLFSVHINSSKSM